MTKQQLQQILANPERLEALKKTHLLDTLPEESFDRLTRLASRILEAPISLVSLVEPQRQFLKSAYGVPPELAEAQETPISHSFCKHVAASGNMLVVDDARQTPLVKDNPAIQDLGVIAYLGVPLTSEDGWHLGSFCVIDNQPRHWTDDQIEAINDLAASVMTEIKLRLEAERRETALKELRARNDELDAFAHTVSHNLKNPISAIIGWAEVSKRYKNRIGYDELLDNISKIDELAHHTSEIVESLLLLAGIGRDGDVEVKRVDMFSVLEKAISRLQPQIEATRCILHLPEEFPHALGYANWLVEVWDNYISNAIKYGGKPPEIRFGGKVQDDGFVRYWIKDNGYGLAPEDQTDLFVQFTRLPQSSYVEGHGLGLSIVQRIVEKLGGTVGVESAPGKGSAFYFTLPGA